MAAEGEVAEAGGGVDQEMGEDQGGGAAAGLVEAAEEQAEGEVCLLYTSPSPRDRS